MLYFVIKCTLSGIIIAVISEVAKRSPSFGGIDRFLAVVVAIGNIVALARYRRREADRESGGIDVLVRPAVATAVSSSTCNAPLGHRLLAQFGRELCPDRLSLPRHRLGARQVWH